MHDEPLQLGQREGVRDLGEGHPRADGELLLPQRPPAQRVEHPQHLRVLPPRRERFVGVEHVPTAPRTAWTDHRVDGVMRPDDELRPPLHDQPVTPHRRRRGERPGHREDRAAQLRGVVCGVERPGPRSRLHHHGRAPQRGDQPVPREEPPPGRSRPGRRLGEQRALPRDVPQQLDVAGRVELVDPAREDRGRRGAGRDGDPVRGGVDAVGAAADDRAPGIGRRRGDLRRRLGARHGVRPRPHDGEGRSRCCSSAPGPEDDRGVGSEVVHPCWPRGRPGDEQPRAALPGRRDDREHVGAGQPRSPPLERRAHGAEERHRVLCAGDPGVRALLDQGERTVVLRRPDGRQGTFRPESLHERTGDRIPGLDHGRPRHPRGGLDRVDRIGGATADRPEQGADGREQVDTAVHSALRSARASRTCRSSGRSAPCRSARVQATRIARSHPRIVSVPRSSAWSRTAVAPGTARPGPRSHAPETSALRVQPVPASRSRITARAAATACLASAVVGVAPSAPRISPVVTRGTRTRTSIRSRSGPDIRPRYRRTAAGGHSHGCCADPAFPHGHGFAASTTWQRAGNSAAPAARCTVIRPDSSGCRSASSTARGNSGASSRKSTPRVARDTAPGRTVPDPPPISDTAEAEWCGASHGGRVVQDAAPCPATERTAATSSAASSSRSGSSPGSRSASMVFPAPGGPTNSAWCPPAAAVTRARTPTGFPTTSASSATGDRSGRAGGTRTGSTSTGGSSAPASMAAARSESTGWTSTPRTNRASSALPVGSTTRSTPASRAVRSIGTTPGTGRSRPSSPSSPMYTTRSSTCGATSAPARTAMAIARSNPEPRFGTAAGVRLTVMRRAGSGAPAFAAAARTRSRASPNEVSGRPMMLKAGSWLVRCASTSIRRPVTPSSATAADRPMPLTGHPPRARTRTGRRRRAPRPRPRGSPVRAPRGARRTTSAPADAAGRPSGA
ncbi:hypothetical protein Cus16_0063 [Curtobacterium sp. ER1/6]|nr:hypothetical protein Cus16_0063 [Curtobacterium sp. ER1/6]